jgi:hypothetical protein
MIEDFDGIPTDGVLPDDYEWGRERLDRFLQEFCGTRLAADENLLLDIAKRAASWQLPPPRWTRHSVGSYELNTPYGLLTVQRVFGWVVKRDGAHLARMHDDNAIFFDKLEDAKTIALLHAGDRAVDWPADGTQWANPPNEINCSGV